MYQQLTANDAHHRRAVAAPHWPRAVAIAAVALAAACGGESDDDGTAPTTLESEVDPIAPTSTAESNASSATSATAEPTSADGFPLTIEHAFGTTEIADEPQRIVTLSNSEHDYVLAVGAQPVGVRPNYVGQPFAVWPWAEDRVEGDDPELLQIPELNVEQVAALEPDLIFAIDNVLDESEYRTLSQIAPVVARPSDTEPGEVPWRTIQRIVGAALDREAQAEQVIADIDDRFAEVRAANPSFTESEAAIAYIRADGALGSFRTNDIAYELLTELGFSIPSALTEAGDAAIQLGAERIDLLDADVLIWSLDGATLQTLQDVPTRPTALRAAQERREVLIDPIMATALIESSPLSIDYVIDGLVGDLALAVDGDPDTVAQSAVALYDVISADDAPTAEQQAAMDAWEIVLGPDVPIDAKRPHIADFDELRPTIEQALAVGQAAGTSPIESTRATIDGNTATIQFSTELNGEAVTDLPAEMTLVDGVWVASREQVCSYLIFVGVECPPTP